MLHVDVARFSPYEGAFHPAVMLSDYSFSLCGGPCAGMFLIEGPEMLGSLVQICRKMKIPFRVLGAMSNVLINDSGFDGIVLLNRKGRINHSDNGDGSATVTADSGAAMSGLVKYCAQNGLSGMEWASGLPGTVGGAVYGNAGAFGSDISTVFLRGEFLDDSGNQTVLSSSDLDFGYRTSALKKGLDHIILEAVFHLKYGDPEQISELGREYKEKRKNSQPYNEHSLGSVFKNPEGCSAGKLIDDAGLKGVSFGKARVSNKHANFITTEKGVTSSDYKSLVDHVQRKVEEVSGIHLEPEIEFVGFQDK